LNASLRGASLAKSGLAGFHWCSKESLHKQGFSKVDTGFGIKTSAQTKESKQPFVGEARNVCLGRFPEKWQPVFCEKARPNND